MVLIRKSVSIWILCEFIVLPFNYMNFPSFGSYFHWFLHPVTNWIYQFFGGESTIINPTISDSASSFIIAVLMIPFILGSVFIFERGLKKEINVNTLELLTLYFLSFFLLRYGLDKLLGNQFQTPEPNILNVRVGDLSKDLLFWTSMGTSGVYNQFMGWSEVICGIILLVPKSRKLGLYMSCGIFVNVFFINVGFDISVKFLSALLLFTSIWLLMLQRSDQLKSTFKHAFIVHGVGLFLLLEILVSSVQLVDKSKPQLTGTFIVKYSNTEQIHPLSELHFNSKGYFMIQNGDEIKSYPLKISGKNFEVSLKKQTVLVGSIANDTLYACTLNDTVIAIKSKRDHVLLKDETHWVVENF